MPSGAWQRTFGLVRILVVCIGLAVLTQCPKTIPGDTIYMDEANSIPIRIALNRIGVMLKPGGPDTLSDSYLSALGATVFDSLPGRIFILDLGAPTTRHGIRLKAHQALDLDTMRIGRAGFVVNRRNGTPATTPMLVTDEFVAHFKAGVTMASIDSLNDAFETEVVEENPDHPGQYLLRVDRRSRRDAIETANIYFQNGRTEFAHPNFIYGVQPAGDPLVTSGDQWHHVNQGNAGGTLDADLDTDEAWAVVPSVPADLVLAIIDGGFDVGHRDFQGALWENQLELYGATGADDDKNGYVDDINGWDFYECFAAGDPTGKGGCGSLVLNPAAMASTDLHGTATAALAGAVRNNNIGGAGVAAGGRLMLIRRSYDEYNIARSFDYARQNGALIISNSWRLLPDNRPNAVLRNAIKKAALSGRGGKGCLIFFAMSDLAVDDGVECSGCPPALHNLPWVISVSGSDCNDKKAPDTGFGQCTEMVAPAQSTIRRIATSDQTGTAGYNLSHAYALSPGCGGDLPDGDYTKCFTGTSAATPLAAGVAGLVLARNRELQSADVRRILQDSADKIGVAAGSPPTYSPVNGHGSEFGWGRVNALEAVRLTPQGPCGPGAGGVDVFLRDDDQDWGNRPRTGGPERLWKETDLRCDLSPYASMSPQEFEGFKNELPAGGQKARIHIRFRNRGPCPESGGAMVRVFGAGHPGATPNLPADFWTTYRQDRVSGTTWKFLGKYSALSVRYSGATIAGAEGDAAMVGSLVDPSTGGTAEPVLLPSGSTASYYSFFAVLDSPEDPARPPAGTIDPRAAATASNNISLVVMDLP